MALEHILGGRFEGGMKTIVAIIVITLVVGMLSALMYVSASSCYSQYSVLAESNGIDVSDSVHHDRVKYMAYAIPSVTLAGIAFVALVD